MEKPEPLHRKKIGNRISFDLKLDFHTYFNEIISDNIVGDYFAECTNFIILLIIIGNFDIARWHWIAFNHHSINSIEIFYWRLNHECNWFI